MTNFDESLAAMSRRARFRRLTAKVATSPARAEAALKARKAAEGREYGLALLRRLDTAQSGTVIASVCHDDVCTNQAVSRDALVFSPSDWSEAQWKAAR